MWTIDLFLDELRTVRRVLGLDRIHVLGQSWGGMLGMEYALTQPEGVVSFVIASSPASMLLWVQEANRLREALPPEVQATLLAHEEAGTTSDAGYQEAMQEFYNRHVCRVVPNPDYVQRSFQKLGHQVYEKMNGPSEFHVVGTLRDWDIRDRLPEITLPCLMTSGRYDECTPMQAEIVANSIPGCEWVLFEESSHMPHVEETGRYVTVLDEFFARQEAR